MLLMMMMMMMQKEWIYAPEARVKHEARDQYNQAALHGC
jgi:hypothetical protein